MTDVVKIALIVSAAPTLSSIAVFIQGLRNHKEVIKSVNGVQEKLIETTRSEAFAAGVKSETDKGTR